jgi:enoyl-CoA hydratase
MILLGRSVAAEEALAIGLVNRIAGGDLVEAGKGFAREMTGFSRAALGLARDAVRRGLRSALMDGLAIEADLSALAFQTADAAEGMAAFLEKRKPVFRDR